MYGIWTQRSFQDYVTCISYRFALAVLCCILLKKLSILGIFCPAAQVTNDNVNIQRKKEIQTR